MKSKSLRRSAAGIPKQCLCCDIVLTSAFSYFKDYSEYLKNSGYNDFQVQFMKNINKRHKSTNDWPEKNWFSGEILQQLHICFQTICQNIIFLRNCFVRILGRGPWVIFLNRPGYDDITILLILATGRDIRGFFLPWLGVIFFICNRPGYHDITISLILATGQDIRGFFCLKRWILKWMHHII